MITHKIPLLNHTSPRIPNPPKIFYLRGIPVDSGIVEGTAEVHEIIMGKELKIPTEDNDQVFRTRLYLSIGIRNP
jgi:hypothetical protein